MKKTLSLLIFTLALLVSANGMVFPEKDPEDQALSKELGLQEEDFPEIPSTNAFLVTPLNTAVEIGQQATLYCQSDVSEIAWFFFPTGQTNYEVVVNKCVVNPAYADRFRAEYHPDGHCDIVILSATERDAGRYSCFQSELTDQLAGAVLTVITSQSNCTSNATVGDLFEFEYVEHFCSVRYTDNLSPMLIKWIDNWGEPVEANEEISQSGYTASKIILQAKPTALDVFTSYTYFRNPPDLITTANNTPTYNSSWKSPASPVKFQLMSPQNTIAPAGAAVNMTCRRRSQYITWVFVTESRTIVAAPCIVVPSALGIYNVDSTLDACHLLINYLEPHHEGTYTCQDVFDPSGETFSATLSIG